MFDWRDYGNGIIAFDAGYVRPILAAIHMVVENGRVAFIDTGSNDALPNALSALKKIGLDVSAVDYVILTHIHLDHAGGAGSLMRAFPKAKLVVHPRGARHMAEPAKLVAGVTAVYGVEYVQRVYGEILPIAADRIIEAPDGLSLSLAGRELLCLDTPGHARHHICIDDKKTSGIFTGDMFGLSYRELDVEGRQFIFPTTTPTQFEPEAMRESIRRLLSFNPEAMYLTHYSRVPDVQKMGVELLRHLDAVIAMAQQEKDAGELRHERIKQAITDYLLAEIRKHGCLLPESELLAIWETDMELNAQGLEVWLDSAKV
ncbi:MBL fold metallo-hydrolase [Ferribacterium limneticum]|uniref:MBL fold metallo-hydrolase n=1 Tax=Ferribacterium limneticum TaxID=76259 RepID=UPI001CFC0781|nr:MBL fold metallo-hydrolase [Ferribacterium limneticum]UCV27790.1 MBL fold metallo-hydrolase [Ferribacterium limneticum]UCV31707.1 MBL fold metallo-hydrolase [Ferribacterium limneticum]